MTRSIRSIAMLAVAALSLAGCGGGSQTTNQIPPTPTVNNPLPQGGGAITIAGVGDSLTAGVQSGGLLGANVPGPLGVDPQLGAIAPSGIQATQQHGFFALMWTQANGGNAATLSVPGSSPLPLMAPLGVGDLLAPTSSGIPAPVTSECDKRQIVANDVSTALQLRLNPGTTPYDVAVPGATTHQALFMTGVLGNCAIAPGNTPAAIVGLNALVNGASQNYGPIVGSFGTGVTQVGAAAALHARLATVWLGSNELLQVAFSNGTAPVVAPQSIHDDIVSIVRQLQSAGSKVVVSNLVDVLSAATFIPQPAYAATLQQYITGALVQQGIPPAQAAALAGTYAPAYAAQETAQAGLGANGYFTINALFATLGAATQQIGGGLPPQAPSITGDFVSDATAAEVTSLNGAYNQSIQAAAAQTGAALADVHTLYAQINAAGGIPINPPACCSPVYRGGLTSLDGLHPSNTGYALIANAFIDAADRAYGFAIPDVNVSAVYAGDPYAPGNGVSGFSVTRVPR